MIAAMVVPQSFIPPSMPTAQRCDAPLMAEPSSRRELFSRTGAAVVGFSSVQSVSAKAGEFSKISIFDITGPSISSPYQAGGPQGLKGTIRNPETTYGYLKSDGPILAAEWQGDVAREKAAFDVSSKIVQAQGANIDKKTWWLVRDNLRGQAYNMKANMLALVNVLPAEKKPAAQKAYKKFWTEIESLDLACVKKEYDLAKKEYGDVLEALKAYTALVS